MVSTQRAAPIGADPVAVISYNLWQRQFAGDPASLVGRSAPNVVRPGDRVMPNTSRCPKAGTDLDALGPVQSQHRDQHYLMAMGRLRAGVSIAEAEEDLNGVARELAREYPATNEGWTVSLSSLHTETVGDTARVLWVLLSAVGLVLLVACANVALLSLMRGMDRSEETAGRLALGASSSRLFREFLPNRPASPFRWRVRVVIAVGGVRICRLWLPTFRD